MLTINFKEELTMAKNESKEREYVVSITVYDDDKKAKVFKRISGELAENYAQFFKGELVRLNDWSLSYRTNRKREALDMFCFMHIFNEKIELTMAPFFHKDIFRINMPYIGILNKRR